MRNLWKLINGKPVNISTMQTGTLRNGYTVSGYYALPTDILQNEGWKPLTKEQEPEPLDGVTHESYYEETETEIFERHRIVIPEEV
jgi:hypothetical protein